MVEGNLCNKCKKEMELLRQEMISGTQYNILKCKICKHQVARTES